MALSEFTIAFIIIITIIKKNETNTANETVSLIHTAVRLNKIEKKYHMLKNKIKLESIAGKSTIYVYQDFSTPLFVYNRIQDVLQESNIVITKECVEKKDESVKQVNENIAIRVFREQLIKIMFGNK